MSAAADSQAVSVTIGTEDDTHLVAEIVQMVNDAYGYARLSEADVRKRLGASAVHDAAGWAGAEPNRVLHLAFLGGKLAGCISSTYTTPWTPSGCGHWGLLAVGRSAQGKGVASALVRAAEKRLFMGGLHTVQIEYEHVADDARALRLCDWYEGKLGFAQWGTWLGNRAMGCLVGHGSLTERIWYRPVEFRRCRRKLPAVS